MHHKKTIYLNGKFLAQKTTGVQRFAREILYEIDKLVGNNNSFRIVVISPTRSILGFDLSNITIKFIPARFGLHFWEQLSLPLATYGSLLLNLTGSAPILKSLQICSIHDVAIEDCPESYGLLYRLWYKTLNRLVCHSAKSIITVSDFSKNRLLDVYKTNSKKIKVVYNASDGFSKVTPDFHVLKKFDLVKSKYILMVGSAALSKNIDLIRTWYRKSEYQKVYKLVIVGDQFAPAFKSKSNIMEPISDEIYTGRVDDTFLKALYQHAFIFVFPSKYEGFGIPPLEAMTCYCPVICSNSTSLPEVCGGAAEYFDANDINSFDGAFKLCLNEDHRSNLVKKGKMQLNKYSWTKSAVDVLEIVKCTQ